MELNQISIALDFFLFFSNSVLVSSLPLINGSGSDLHECVVGLGCNSAVIL